MLDRQLQRCRDICGRLNNDFCDRLVAPRAIAFAATNEPIAPTLTSNTASSAQVCLLNRCCMVTSASHASTDRSARVRRGSNQAEDVEIVVGQLFEL